MSVTVSAQLLAEAKRFLDITWDDDETDAKLTGEIRRGVSYITAKTGVSASAFAGDSADDRAQDLLFSYLLYSRAGAVDQFQRNYSPELNSLRRRSMVQARLEVEDEETESEG